MPRRLKLTMDDVARAANVSKQTVSAVINNKSGISEKTRVRIRRIIAKLDYEPNMLASSLRGHGSFTVGVVIPSITNPFYPEMSGASKMKPSATVIRFFCVIRMKIRRRRSSISSSCAGIASRV
jgi:transcriptional regulator with XRE-family HTH domain